MFDLVVRLAAAVTDAYHKRHCFYGPAGTSTTPFAITTEGPNRRDLRYLCETFVNELWIPDHLLPHEREESALDLFKWTLAGELELLSVQTQTQE